MPHFTRHQTGSDFVFQPKENHLDNKFAGMTVNERLVMSGLMDDFEKALLERHAEKARAILEKVELSEANIRPILDR